jgi:hypothetical protein
MFVCALSQLPKRVWFDRKRAATIRQTVNGSYTVWSIATRTKFVVIKAEITIRTTNAYLATVTELVFDGFEEEILPLVTKPSHWCWSLDQCKSPNLCQSPRTLSVAKKSECIHCFLLDNALHDDDDDCPELLLFVVVLSPEILITISLISHNHTNQ